MIQPQGAFLSRTCASKDKQGVDGLSWLDYRVGYRYEGWLGDVACGLGWKQARAGREAPIVRLHVVSCVAGGGQADRCRPQRRQGFLAVVFALPDVDAGQRGCDGQQCLAAEIAKTLRDWPRTLGLRRYFRVQKLEGPKNWSTTSKTSGFLAPAVALRNRGQLGSSDRRALPS